MALSDSYSTYWHWTGTGLALGTGHWARALDTGLDDGEVAGQVRLDQGVGGVGGKAGLEEGDGLVVRWFDHSLSSRMMLSWLRLGGHWLLFSWSQQSSCDSAQLQYRDIVMSLQRGPPSARAKI